jgi:methyl-accepting chemotaxis protein
MAKLAKPTPAGIAESRNAAVVEMTATKHDDANRQREEARQRAQQKAAARTAAKRQQAAERVATATEQLSSGVQEASAAIGQLAKAMEQISTGAQEASSASQECLAAIEQISKASVVAKDNAKASMDKVNSIQIVIRSTSTDIGTLIEGVSKAAKANIESAKLIIDLERQSKEIGEIVEAVVRIADQTNLLALNAAIEAARAGQHGKGFAVVADEVRNLAETSEKSARNISQLVEQIQADVKMVVEDVEKAGKDAAEEVEKAKAVTQGLKIIETDTGAVQRACVDVDKNAQESAVAAEQFRKGADSIAAAAEEAVSAAEEASKSTQEQQKALEEMSKGAEDLSTMAEALKTSSDTEKSSEEMAAAAEELSSTLQESNSAAQQILSAIGQIAKGTEQQASATQESAAAAKQIENGAKRIQQNATESLTKVESLQKVVAESKKGVDQMIIGITAASEASAKSAENIKTLESRTRAIDKIVDAIVNVTIQTNLLAVNGSIEAARAGEYGRGFAVVAADVRNLAGESSENADKIKDLVRRVQQQIVTVATDIEAAGRGAASEVEKAKRTTANLNQIEADMKSVGTSVLQIKDISDSSLVAIEQATKGVQQIASAAQQAGSATEEASTAAQQQAKGMQELGSAVEEISALADELQNS